MKLKTYILYKKIARWFAKKFRVSILPTQGVMFSMYSIFEISFTTRTFE